MALNTSSEKDNNQNKETSNTASATDASKTSEVNKELIEKGPQKPYDPYAIQLEGIKFPYFQKKEVIIKRRITGGALPGLDADETREKIGSSFKGASVNRGLTKDEERRWLAPMLGLDLQSSEWEKGTKEYWANISAEVPPNGKNDLGGLKLETGLFYETREQYIQDLDRPKDINGVIINPSGEPINLADYILWRYCLGYVEVANDITLVNNSPKIRFYMFTKEKQIQDKKLLLDRKRKAEFIYNQNISDRGWVDHMLHTLIPGDKDARILLKDIATMEDDEKDITLHEYLEKDVIRFISIGNDKNLEMRSLIELAVATGRLHRIPNTTTLLFEGSTIGNTPEEAVAYLNNPKFNDVLRTIKAQVNITP